MKDDAQHRGFKWRGIHTIVWSRFFCRELYCVFWYRFNHFLYRKGCQRTSNLVKSWRQRQFCNEIDPESDIGQGIVFGHITGIVIGKGVKIGKNANVQQNVTLGVKYWPQYKDADEDLSNFNVPRIGDNVLIGAGSVVVGSISIGDNVTIGALSFIDCEVPSNSTIYGIPPNRTIKLAT